MSKNLVSALFDDDAISGALIVTSRLYQNADLLNLIKSAGNLIPIGDWVIISDKSDNKENYYAYSDDIPFVKDSIYLISDISRIDQDLLDKLVDYTVRGSKVIILTTWGASNSNLNMLNIIIESFPGLLMMKLQTNLDKIHIYHKMIPLEASELQVKQIGSIVKDNFGENNFPEAPLTNYTYPKSVGSVKETLQVAYNINVDKEIKYPADEVFDVSKDKFTGWITNQTIRTINSHSSKLSYLLNRIVPFSNKKHIILTKYENRYGVKLIASMMELLKIPFVTLLNTDDDKNYDDKISKFKELKNGVLISSRESKETNSFVNTSTLHVLDTFDPLMIADWIARLYKFDNLCDSKDFLEVNLYFTTIDSKIIDKMQDSGDNAQSVYNSSMDCYDKVYKHLVKSSVEISITPDGLMF